uniref:Dirigent protein n=1 Tax=Picea sitchensis TaxID=3332 RepID=Q27J95_PICSI|nr:dirigent-like protein pDIR17 [Picea sitchensis]
MGKLSVRANIAEIAMSLLVLLCVLQRSDGTKEKTTHLHFYFHDRLAGINATAVAVASANVTSATGFGGVVVLDDPLTEGPNVTSKLLGRAQGLYAGVGQEQHVLLMVLTFVFQTGEYNGSTLTMVGNDVIFNKVRELPIVGGSGVFRLARGYALLQTITAASSPGNATVEHNVTVYHY